MSCKPLSLININSKAPYLVEQDEESYTFVTESGVDIAIDFDVDELVQSGPAYQFLIKNRNNRPSPRDTKMRDTIVAIVEEFFDKNEAALLYICETGDGKQAMRSRLFSFWFEIYGDQSQFFFLPMTVIDEDGIDNYAALVIRKDNPYFTDIVTEFTATINMLNRHKL